MLIGIKVLWCIVNCQVARAAAIFKVDEIVVFEENAANPR